MSRVKRHDWEDAIIEAGARGLIKPGAVNVCLRLAKAITWCPQGQKSGWPSGLYWKNGLALKSVGSSTSSWSDYRQSLFDAGFFIEEGQNLIPQIPDLSEIRTTEEEATVRDSEDLSEIRNEVSEIRNEVSEIDYPYSVLSSVPSSVNTSSVVPSVADAPEAAISEIQKEPMDVTSSTSTGISEFDTSSEPITAGGDDDSTSPESTSSGIFRTSEPAESFEPQGPALVDKAPASDGQTCAEPAPEAGTCGTEDFRKSQSETVGQPRDSSHLSGWDDEAATPSLRDQVVLRAGRAQMAEIDGLLGNIDADRERYAERLYDYALENNQFTQLALAPVLMDWQKSDGAEVSKSLVLSMW